MTSQIKSIVKLLRPKQWVKNAIIFAPITFAGYLLDFDYLLSAVICAFLFCFLSSSVYVLNDIIDAEKDRMHPKKRKRPIACGQVSVLQAAALLVVILSLSLVIAFLFNIMVFALLAAYFVLMLFYSFYLKRIPILDVMIIASGFVIRLLSGIAIIDGFETGFSPWMVMCTILLSLFLALNKRKSEAINGEENQRDVLKNYKPEMLDKMIGVVDSSAIMAFCLWVITGDNMAMMLTIPFVIYGLFRYQYLAYAGGDLETPELVLLTDKPLLIDIFLWAATCFAIIYIV